MQEPNALHSWFHAELEAEAQRNAWGLKERVLWILDHLDEYIERWLGFAALHISPQALIQSDLFTTIEIAIDALEREFSMNVAVANNRYVRNIRENFECFRRHGDRESVASIKALAAELRSAPSLLGDARSA